MNEIVQNIVGMGDVTDQVIATDFLIAAKSAVKMYAFAVTETATPELKATLTAQLDNAVNKHEQITDYMISKGYYHPYNITEQIQVDYTAAQTALNLPQP
jgi:similar to spore coat protein